MGWNGSGGNGVAATNPQHAACVPSRRRLTFGLLAVLVAAVAGIAVWLSAGPDGTTRREEAARNRDPGDMRPGKKAGGVAPADEPPKRLQVPKLSGVRIEKRENIPAPQPIEEMNEAATNSAARQRIPFRNGMEQLIALAMPTEPGSPVPPLPPITDESVADEVKRGLGNIIRAEEGDSPELLEKKLAVASAKEEFRSLRDAEGWGFVEYVNALRDQANLDSQFMSEAHKICDELYHDSSVSDEDYISYRDQVNAMLRERGLPEIEKEESEKEASNE